MRYTNSSLVQKIGNPMKPDVYEAGARVLNMMEQKKKQVRGVTEYATNTFEIMVPADNPKHIKSIEDHAK